ncbi:uncharacterized protein BXZ73DRAFT_50983 [Epithele typhae]|uniref:uncharacterized protein n=1 Tax=Epithele typhae TaxID=378194 RepID=UPI0020078FCE|nr:uncharacterized protein BXZ73DRAFT_50983 [Epithele typhae]KAH9923465.1 hypothetical protein BXZ73DRAFT_50983 [Epithele typhae]
MPAYRTRDASARTLHVATDAPPPTVSIISPTPRAFTFPITDTRFPTSPSASPFEPALKSVPCTPPPPRPFSPTSSIGSDSSLSVLSSPTAPPSSQASSHRRRRSTVSDAGERRPKKGDDDYIKRPENAFILFRRRKCEERQEAAAAQDEDGPVKKQRQADLSKDISQQWKSLPADERAYWEQLAKEKKKEHEALYPNYVYRPQRTKGRKEKLNKGKLRPAPEGAADTESDSFSFLLPVSGAGSPARSLSRGFALPHAHGHGRRAASAPTPPPYQEIQLPSVWMPSCPASPTQVPRISGRSPAPMANIPSPSESAPLRSYDYSPHDNMFMSPYQAPPAFDLQVSPPGEDPYANMFHISTDHGVVGGPLLHALSIPAARDAPPMMSPADSIASSLVSPADTYGAMTPASAHPGPFTPADALQMMSLAQHQQQQQQPLDGKDAPVDGMVDLPYGFWPGETLWANMEGLMPEDFNLGSIPPVELGLAQFEAMPGAGSAAAPGCEEGPAAGSALCPEWMRYDERQDAQDYDDRATPGGPDPFGAYAHDPMNGGW